MHLSVAQLAESLGVAESVIEGWVRDEGLPALQDRNRLLFDRAEVLAWSAARGLAARAGFLTPAPTASLRPLRLRELLANGGIRRDVPAAEVRRMLEEITDALPDTSAEARQMLRQRVRSRDGITWAPVGDGLALPHLRVPVALGRTTATLSIFLLRDDLSLDEPPPDGLAVRQLIFFIAPSPRAHLEILGRLSRALVRGPLRSLVRSGAPDTEIADALDPADPVAAGS